jgi:hypothetical protein
MLRPFVGAGNSRGSWRYRRQRGSSGFVGQFFLALVFSVVLPVVWWTVALLGRLYQRTFVLFTEFLTGVYDWNTYRTSALKYGGIAFAFVGFNGALLILLNLITLGFAGPRLSTLGWAGILISTVASGAVARILMRRMPHRLSRSSDHDLIPEGT